MIKKISIYLTAALAICFLASCVNEDSYSYKRKKETAKWAEYLEKQNLTLSEDSAYCFSQPVPWPEKLYFKTHRGAYIRLTKDNKDNRTAKSGSTIILRFKAYDLDGNLIGDTDVTHPRDGFEYVYNPNNTSPSIAFIDAGACIHHESEFEMLVDSKLGTQDQKEVVLTLNIKINETTIRPD